MWQFEPATAPITKTVEIEYGFPKECPGPISESGEVAGSGRLTDKSGNLVAVVDDNEYSFSLPPYPETERKAGVAGNMVLALPSVRMAIVKEIHACQVMTVPPVPGRITLNRRFSKSKCNLSCLLSPSYFACCHCSRVYTHAVPDSKKARCSKCCVLIVPFCSPAGAGGTEAATASQLKRKK